MSETARILIVDDDPLHLKLHSWILEQKGFVTTGVIVSSADVVLPKEQEFDLVLLDYRFSSGIKAADIAKKIAETWPAIRIVVLSDMMWMPDDMTSLATAFVRKGDPEQLIDKITELSAEQEQSSRNV